MQIFWKKLHSTGGINTARANAARANTVVVNTAGWLTLGIIGWGAVASPLQAQTLTDHAVQTPLETHAPAYNLSKNNPLRSNSPQSNSLENNLRQVIAARPIRFRRTNTPPPDRGTPRTPYGTGSRGDCASTAEHPPLTQLAGNAGMTFTVSEYPSFWVYVPYMASDITAGQFSLQEGDREIYRAAVQLPSTPGIIGIAAPEAMPPLELGKSYRWYFEVSCSQSDPSETPTPATVTGTVERVSPSAALASELESAQSPLEEISAYANNQIWYDTFTQFAQLRLSDPGNTELITLWEDFLGDPEVGLEDWSDEPIVGEATLNNAAE